MSNNGRDTVDRLHEVGKPPILAGIVLSVGSTLAFFLWLLLH